MNSKFSNKFVKAAPSAKLGHLVFRRQQWLTEQQALGAVLGGIRCPQAFWNGGSFCLCLRSKKDENLKYKNISRNC